VRKLKNSCTIRRSRSPAQRFLLCETTSIPLRRGSKGLFRSTSRPHDCAPMALPTPGPGTGEPSSPMTIPSLNQVYPLFSFGHPPLSPSSSPSASPSPSSSSRSYPSSSAHSSPPSSPPHTSRKTLRSHPAAPL